MAGGVGCGARFDRGLIFMTGLDRIAIRRHYKFLLAIILIAILANAPMLLGLVNCDPEIITSGLGEVLSRWSIPGNSCFVDPTVGQLLQPLGYVSAQDWLHGIIPWWDPYLGVGMPMAAEMQTESFFFPFVLLLHFHSGWLMQKLAFQILSGVFTYMFLVEIGLVSVAALLGGALFSLNGTFILTPHAAIAPIFFLPLFLLGLEHAADAARHGRKLGWSLIVVAVAGSIYAGYPEVAFFDGLLALVWAIFRFLQLPGRLKYRFAGKVASGAITGLLIATPLVSAFLQYLAVAEIGSHDGFLAHDMLTASAAPLQMFPLFYGVIGPPTPDALVSAFHQMWVRFGGWFGCLPVLLMLLAISRTQGRDMARYVLLGWIIFWQARYFGFPGAMALANLVPGIASADSIRFSPVSVEFAVFVLAAHGFDDLLRADKYSRAELIIWFMLSTAIAALSIVPALKYYPIWFDAFPRLYPAVIIYFACMIVFSICLAVTVISRRFAAIPGILVIAESLAICLISQSGAPQKAHLDTTGLQVLNVQKDFGRIYSTGTFTPDYPAAYGIASLNHEQLPIPKIWTNYLKSALFPNADPISFAGGQSGQDLAILMHFPTYEQLGVRYLIVPPGDSLFSPSTGPLAANNLNFYNDVSPGQDYQNVLRPRQWPDNSITHVSVVAGTFFGASRGMLNINICSAELCATGQANLATAADNRPLIIKLDHPLTIRSGASFFYRFSLQGSVVALWLVPTLDNGVNSVMIPAHDPSLLVFGNHYSVPAIPLIHHDDRMDIYQLPDPAPYAQTLIPACGLIVYSRQKMQTDCAKPTILVRRELFYPGWRARVNGVDTPVTQTEDIFEKITIPAGPAKIRFTYMPPYTPFACAAAIAALLFWLAAAQFSRRRPVT